MKRLLLAATFLIAATGAALAGSLPATLKPIATIEGDAVRLGDLWDNLDAKAETVIAPAPQAGKRITADARWLLAVAQNHGVNWQPATAFDRIVIERAGQVVDIKLIESEVREALTMEGVPVPFGFDISNRLALNMTIPATGNTVGIAIRDMVWDPRNNRFTATVEAPAGAPNALRQRIDGRVFQVARIPVLNRTVGRGDIITERDIEWIEARAEVARRDIVADARQLVGQEARLQVRQGSPIRVGDLQRPVMVPRNSTVTIVLKTPFMTLTTQGRASEEGGKGDVIHVTNLQSKRVVEAVVEGPGTVSVMPNGAVALAN
jgi:flagella basal body P-ring formation protein FlgA